VCDLYGPTDFLQMDANRLPDGQIHDAPDSLESKLVGGPIQDNPDKVRRANPITYVSKNAPPFLIVHGELDRLVPFNQKPAFGARSASRRDLGEVSSRRGRWTRPIFRLGWRLRTLRRSGSSADGEGILRHPFSGKMIGSGVRSQESMLHCAVASCFRGSQRCLLGWLREIAQQAGKPM
jgi:hypothetical protein